MQKLLEAGVYDAGGTSQTLGAMMYLGPYAKAMDMGGKTGTSNNHSDAWFVAVTPSLVAGAWVGGEYRSIHFRTGALGQGSRTALPIVASFLRKVMDNPSLRGVYQRKYGMPPSDVEPSTYQATYNPPASKPDSLANDSLSENGEFDENDLMGGMGNEESRSENEGEQPASHSEQSSTSARKDENAHKAQPNSKSGGNSGSSQTNSSSAKTKDPESLFN